MSERLAHLDGLRGVAACLVLYQHLAETLVRVAPDVLALRLQVDLLFGCLNLGKVGVVAFFAISGFIVPSSLRQGGPRPRHRFALSRLFRLYPAFWLSVLAALLLLPLVGGAQIPALQVLANVTMVPALFGQTALLDVYWTLAVEWIFYALCLVLFSLNALHHARGLAWAFGLTLALALVGAWGRAQGLSSVPVSLPLYLSVMWLGASLRLAVLEGDATARRNSRLMLVLLLVAVPVVWATAYDDTTHKESLLAAIAGICGGLLLFLLCVHRRFFSAPHWVWLGGISYALYLFHPLALELAAHAAQRSPAAAAPWLLALLSVAVSLLTAAGVRRWVEKPAQALGRRVAARVDRDACSRRVVPASRP